MHCAQPLAHSRGAFAVSPRPLRANFFPTLHPITHVYIESSSKHEPERHTCCPFCCQYSISTSCYLHNAWIDIDRNLSIQTNVEEQVGGPDAEVEGALNQFQEAIAYAFQGEESLSLM
jgi:hypothetical protein